MRNPFRRKPTDMRALARAARKPELFEDARHLFWADPYISSHVLLAHLDPDTDAASRPPGTIDASTRWIAGLAESRFPNHESIRFLDLGCGPGLYAQRFADRGFAVTGIDISEESIRYARENARQRGLDIRYIHGNYVDALPEERFHVIALIYGDFCVLSNADRDALLDRIRSRLEPDGIFIFDVFRRSYLTERQWGAASDWYVSEGNGFWAKEPHLVLERSFEYPHADVIVRRYVILTEGGQVRAFNIWRHHYSEATITRVLGNHGLRVTGTYADLTGSPSTPHSDWIGLVAEPEEAP